MLYANRTFTVHFDRTLWNFTVVGTLWLRSYNFCTYMYSDLAVSQSVVLVPRTQSFNACGGHALCSQFILKKSRESVSGGGFNALK